MKKTVSIILVALMVFIYVSAVAEDSTLPETDLKTLLVGSWTKVRLNNATEDPSCWENIPTFSCSKDGQFFFHYYGVNGLDNM